MNIVKTTGAFLGATLALFSPALADKVADEASRARPMAAKEVAQVYAGKSWIWAEGAGYFAPNRTFIAYSGSGTAQGKWRVTEDGRMCFRAVWKTKTRSNPANTCFSHRKQGGAIYQKKEPSGNWYVFRNSGRKVADEYDKLQRGDKVSGRRRT